MTTFDILLQLLTEYDCLSVFAVLLAFVFGLPLPEDVTLFASGVIDGLGYANEHSMVLVGLLGVLLGDGVTYWLGRRYGERLTRLLILGRALTPARIARARAVFSRNGTWVMFVARFLPGLRTSVYCTAGMTRPLRAAARAAYGASWPELNLAPRAVPAQRVDRA